MIKNIIFDIGSVIVTEMGAKLFPYLTIDEQNELNSIVYKNQGFVETILGNQSTNEYRERLLRTTPKYHNEINILLSFENMQLAMPKKPEMVRLAYSLKSTYRIYFLSDMIDITFEYLKDFLSDFDGGAYSYQEHTKKPFKDFYEILLERYNLNPKECIFFDDKIHNITTAKELGINGAVFTDIDTVKVCLQNTPVL